MYNSSLERSCSKGFKTGFIFTYLLGLVQLRTEEGGAVDLYRPWRGHQRVNSFSATGDRGRQPPLLPPLLGAICTIGNTRVSVAYYSFYDNIQLYEPVGKALLFTSIS